MRFCLASMAAPGTDIVLSTTDWPAREFCEQDLERVAIVFGNLGRRLTSWCSVGENWLRQEFGRSAVCFRPEKFHSLMGGYLRGWQRPLGW